MKVISCVKTFLLTSVCVFVPLTLLTESFAQYIERPNFFYLGSVWSGYPVRSVLPYELRRRYIHFPDLNLEIDPFIFVTQTWDSNVFYEPGNSEKEDFVTAVSPGVALRWPLRGGRYLFTLGYVADIISFWKYTEESRVDHIVNVAGNFDFNSDFRLLVSDLFQRTADPANSELTEDLDRYRNIANVVLNYDRERWGVEGGYRNVRDYYDDVDYLDKWMHTFSIKGLYRVLVKTSLLAEYEYGVIRYDHPDFYNHNSDGHYHQAMAGVEELLATKLKALFKAGYQWRYYDDESREDFSGLVMKGSLMYALSQRTALELFGEKNVAESTYEGKSYYTIYRAGLKLQQELGRKLILALEGVYQLNRYPGYSEEGTESERRESNLWAGFADLRYQVLEWLSTDLIYSYRQRDDTFPVYDYDRHMLSFQVSAIF